MAAPRFALSVALVMGFLALGETAALAVPVSEPLFTEPGNRGVVIPYGYSGNLGNTGLAVEALPTMLLIKAIAPGSPAAIADLPSPERYRVRVAAVNGDAVEDLSLAQVLQAFNPTRETVTLTLARKGSTDLAESLVGPFTLPLATQGIAGLQADWLLAQRRFGEAHAFLQDRQLDPGQLAERLLLAAKDAAAGGDTMLAMQLAGRIDPTHPLYAEAQHVKRAAEEAHRGEILSQADALAAQGHFPAAIAMVRGLEARGPWGELRAQRESDWTRALTAKAAYKREEAKRRAEAAERAAAARRAARLEAEQEAAERAARRHRLRRRL